MIYFSGEIYLHGYSSFKRFGPCVINDDNVKFFVGFDDNNFSANFTIDIPSRNLHLIGAQSFKNLTFVVTSIQLTNGLLDVKKISFHKASLNKWFIDEQFSNFSSYILFVERYIKDSFENSSGIVKKINHLLNDFLNDYHEEILDFEKNHKN